MKSIKNIHWNSISLKFFLSHLLIIFLALVCIAYSYENVQKVLELNIEKYNLKIMDNTRNLVENRLSEIDAQISRISSSYKTNYTLNLIRPEGTSQMYNLKEYVDYLSDAEVQGTANFHIMVYAPKSNYVFFRSAATSPSQFYTEVFRSDSNMEQWFSNLMDSKLQILQSQNIFIDGMERKVIPYITTLPLGMNNKLGAICVFIDYDSLLNNFNNIDHTNIFIKNSDGNIITASGDLDLIYDSNLVLENSKGFFKQEINGNMMIICYVKSEKYNLSFVSISPLKPIMIQFENIKILFIFVSLLFIIFTIIYSVLFAKKSGNPIMEIYKSLESHTAEKESIFPSINSIYQSIKNLINENHQMSEIMTRQKNEIQTGTLMRLMTGDFYRIDSQFLIERIGWSNESQIYIVAILNIEAMNNEIQENSEVSILKAKICKILEPTHANLTILDTNFNRLVFVFHFSSDAIPYYKRYITFLMKDLEDIFSKEKFCFDAAIGSPKTDLNKLSDSYKEANLAIGISVSKHTNMIYWYSDINSNLDNRLYYYPREIEQQILDYIRNGNILDLSELLDAVIHENIQQLHISESMGKILLSEMKVTLIKYAREFFQNEHSELGDFFKKLSQIENKDIISISAFQALKNAFLDLAEKSLEKKSEYNNLLVKDILEFIDKNYSDPCISLSMLAEKFNLSESYFSVIFKKQTGINYINYLSSKRLEKAYEILNENDTITMEEIAKITGYNSSHSFRRAFKKRYGINPVDYRNSKSKNS